ncbi:type I polyketide synthase [Streptomyces sp. NPDC001544]|uniref:type I polyketide synthase n=1 Tax=Streptomyces sp. NPDC001544 TaxID=3364584 RepID=UPI00369CAB55
MRTELSTPTPLAIVGMGCRLPGIETTDELWDVLTANADTVTPVPHDRFDVERCHDATPMTPGRTVSRHGGFLTDPFGFDAAFFGVSPAEARVMDPQQRLLLHVVWEALESAGIRPSRLAGSRGGVFVGQATSEYADTAPRTDEPDVHGMVGSRLRAVTAGRVSYALDLRGPSVVLDTACSSSLVAVHAARQSLLTGESDLCIAAGVNLILSPHDSIAYSQGGMLSPAGRCRFGDARADGFVRSEGVGAVVLKRLDDALRDGDPVHALLLGSAVTNDGTGSGLLLRPSVEGQADMLREACASAGVKPSELDYVEAHGTGTHVGDEVELRALAEAVGQGASGRPLLTGSVKTNIGHAEAAAGIAGLIKSVLILRHGVIPASLHLDEPHPLLAQDGLPVRVVTRNQPLTPSGPRALLGVSSFGLSGTNAHVVVGAHTPESGAGAPASSAHVRAPGVRPSVGVAEPADATEAIGDTATSATLGDTAGTATAGDTAALTGTHLLVLSARTAGSLRRLAADYADYLGPGGAGRRHRLRDICAAAALGRDTHRHRLWVVGEDHDALSRRLRVLADGENIPDGGTADPGPAGDRPTVFVFSGQGAQWAGMGRALYRSSPSFRSALEACDRAVREELGWSVVDRLTSGAELPTDVDVVQPLLWAVQVALAAAWRERGVQPHRCMGHSMGEVAAAHVAGGLSLEDAAAVICRRSRLMQRRAGRGAMLVVELPADRARRRAQPYGDAVSVAAENAPTVTVLAGDAAALTALRTELERDGVLCRPVPVNVASHSPQMDAVCEDLSRELASISSVPGETRMVSTVDGHEGEAPRLTAGYWADNLRRPVRFADTLRKTAHETNAVFLEVGPHPVLLAAMDDTLTAAGAEASAVASLHRACDEPTELARAAGRLFAHGGYVDWRRWYGDGPRHVLSLPTYAWDAVQYRQEPAGPVTSPRHDALPVRQIDLGAWGATADWGDGVAVHGVAAVPPVAYLAAMVETAHQADPGAPLELRDVHLGDECLPLDAAGDTRLHVVLDDDAQGGHAARSVTVRASVRHAASPVLCASGRVVRAGADDGGHLAPDALDTALARCRDYVGARDFLLLAQRHGHDIAEPFRGTRHLWRRDGEAVARVRPAKLLPHVGWETGLQTILAARPGALSGQDDAAHVPVSFGAVRFHGELEPEFWSLSTVRSADGGALLLADVVLIAPDHRVLARFSDIRLRRLTPTPPASLPLAQVRTLLLPAARPLAHVRSLVPAVTRRCATPLTRLAGKVTAAFNSAESAARAAGQGSAGVRTAPDEAAPRFSAPSSGRTRREGAAQALVAHSAALLGLRASDIDERLSLRDLGLDSLMATRLRLHLQRSHGAEITAGRLLSAESIADLCADLTRQEAQP